MKNSSRRLMILEQNTGRINRIASQFQEYVSASVLQTLALYLQGACGSLISVYLLFAATAATAVMMLLLLYLYL